MFNLNNYVLKPTTQLILKKFSLITIIIVSHLGYTQQLPHLLFYKDNINYFNPAVTGMEGSLIQFNHRSQWLSIPDAPQTTSIRYNSKSKENATWGIMAEADQVFIENRVAISGDYSYQIKVDEISTLNFGLRVGLYNSYFELDNLNRLTSEPNEILNAVSPYIGNIFGAGIHYNRVSEKTNYFLSFSSPNLVNFRRFKTTYSIYTEARDQKHFYTVGGLNYKSGNINLIPHFLIRSVSNAPTLYSGMLGVGYMDNYEIGFGITNNSYMSGYLSIKNFNSFNINAGYEFPTRLDNTALRAGTVEINLIYKFSNGESFTTEQEIEAEIEQESVE